MSTYLICVSAYPVAFLKNRKLKELSNNLAIS